ncbi:MAG TPA: VanW family protein [Blastocatellia bacterium]|nr:VanW family protein [Blastocatellia bacterium]
MSQNDLPTELQIPRQQSMPGALVFRSKALAHQSVRLVEGITSNRRYPQTTSLAHLDVLAESTTSLITDYDPREAALMAGKIHNLRIALRGINGVEVPEGGVFSFWAQIGKPSRRRGYAEGRELRQGCLVPSAGGGLCQLSNALYQCALESGFEIVERHAHTKIVAGSLAEFGRDATVFWNYVDLRFKSPSAFRIEAHLDRDNLVVRFKGVRTWASIPALAPAQTVIRSGPSPRSCASCGITSCARNLEKRLPRSLSFGRTAYLVDEYWPEFDSFIRSNKQREDVIGVPVTTLPFGRPRPAWDTTGFHTVRAVTATKVRRSLELRNVRDQGAARQRVLLKYDRKLAESFAALLTYDVTHVTVSQNLLPFLWHDGYLGGRTFDVLMTRLPMRALQDRLDFVLGRHPESKTLGDFRADDWIVQAESQALAQARKVVTPHSEIAALFGDRAELIPWCLPAVLEMPRPGDGVLFPASTLGRKGAYELRDAAKILDLELAVVGKDLESSGFWNGVSIRRCSANPLHGIGLVVLPAYIEDKPRRLLEAVACGIPVIASAACGLRWLEGVRTLPGIGVGILASEIRSVIGPAETLAASFV